MLRVNMAVSIKLPIFLIACSIFMSSCSYKHDDSKNFVPVSAEQISKINASYYNLSEQGLKGAEFECKSHFFDEMVSRVKDPIAHKQLQQVKFKVKWVSPMQFYSRADNVPEMVAKADTAMVAKAVIHTKDRIRDALQTNLFLFDEIFISKNVTVVRELGFNDYEIVLNVLNSQHQSILRLFFKQNSLLEKIEMINNNKIQEVISCEFERLPIEKFLLKKTTTFDPRSKIYKSFQVLYDTKSPLILPKQIIIESKKRAASENDTIDIVSSVPIN